MRHLTGFVLLVVISLAAASEFGSDEDLIPRAVNSKQHQANLQAQDWDEDAREHASIEQVYFFSRFPHLNLLSAKRSKL